MRRRFCFGFGPGLTIALILTIWIGYQRYQQRQPPPRIERQVISRVSGKPGERVTPDLSFLLQRRKQLSLTDQQIREIERLYREWQQVSGPGQKEAEAAGREFQEWMDSARKRGKTGLPEIQEHGARLSAISAELAQQRRLYWESVMKLLTPRQQEIANRERMKGLMDLTSPASLP